MYLNRAQEFVFISFNLAKVPCVSAVELTRWKILLMKVSLGRGIGSQTLDCCLVLS